jgi:hypothetical protein
MELTLAVRRQVTAAMVKRWPKATKTEKSQMLDQLCMVTGWHRDHARKAVRRAVTAAGADPVQRRARAAVYTYGPDVVAALEKVWAVSDGITGKRLAPFLPDLVAALRRHGELDIDDDVADQLCAMSAATIDRRLAAARRGLTLDGAKGRSLTKPGSLLKSQIPIRTWADWDEHRPGFLEIDLVGHEGGDNNDTFCWTLTGTDIATGWTETRSVRNKAAKWVSGALIEIEAALPFALLGIDSDNGSEFINYHLLNWCQDRQITFTRSRPANSNDGAHVEQKNWTVVRRTVGYWRYDTAHQLALLNQIWTTLSPLTNLFTPQQKLVSKTRTGAKVAKRYDTARTPYQRLLTYPDTLDDIDTKMLAKRYDTLNPAQARRDIAAYQQSLLSLVARQNITRRGRQNATYLSRAKLDESTNHPKRAT